MMNAQISALDLIDQLPFILFKKDPDSFYLYSNNHSLNINIFDNLGEIIGKSDFELPWYKDADKYIEQDQLCLKGVSQFALDYLPRKDGSTMMHLCHKSPIYNDKRKIIGIAGIGVELTFQNYKNIVSVLAFAGLKIEDFRIPISKKSSAFVYGNIGFSKREAQIISFLLRGYSAESTAHELHLSRRTIEFHLTRLKNKLECRNKHELVNKAFKLSFIDLMFMKL